jgi:DNA-binding transcriptional regulator YhcF (GntR family)
MSWDAIAWASQQTAGGSTDKLILILLANYADEHGVSFPSHKTLATKAECGLSTVERALRRLSDNGLISITQRFETGVDGSNRQTSNSYQLKLGVTNMKRGVTKMSGGREGQNDDPITNNNKPLSAFRYPAQFNNWWNLYPNKSGSKKKAYDLWHKATDLHIDEHDLFLLTARYAQSVKGTEVKYIPHATTWLNQRRWEVVPEKQKEQRLNNLAG